MPREMEPTLSLDHDTVRLHGHWRVGALAQRGRMARLRTALNAAGTARIWDLRTLDALDHAGALLLWQCWGRMRPAQLLCLPAHEGLFTRLHTHAPTSLPRPPRPRLSPLMRLGRLLLQLGAHALGLLILLGQLVLDLGRFVRHPLAAPWPAISANLYRTGAQALGITALVGMLIGIVLSYLSAQQLRTFGGDLYIINILGMSIVRELGPMLSAILVAGRSGSAFTAQLGVMRVTEELDAMRVMGIAHGFRLILPRVLALSLAMPLLVIWTDLMALAGGWAAAHLLLGMSPGFFLYKLPEVVPILNFWIGLMKGAVFGMLIALIACHFGLRIAPNTESLGQGTTQSVVVSITVVIIVDALFAILFSGQGY